MVALQERNFSYFHNTSISSHSKVAQYLFLVIDNFKVRKGLKGMKSFLVPDNFVQSFRVDHRANLQLQGHYLAIDSLQE